MRAVVATLGVSFVLFASALFLPLQQVANAATNSCPQIFRANVVPSNFISSREYIAHPTSPDFQKLDGEIVITDAVRKLFENPQSLPITVRAVIDLVDRPNFLRTLRRYDLEYSIIGSEGYTIGFMDVQLRGRNHDVLRFLSGTYATKRVYFVGIKDGLDYVERAMQHYWYQ